MSATLTSTSPLAEAVGAALGEAAGPLLAAGVPTRRTEDHRYVSMRRLDEGTYALAAPSADAGTGPSLVLEGLDDRRLVLVDGVPCEALSSLGRGADGVEVTVGRTELSDPRPESGPGARGDFFRSLGQAIGRPVVHLAVAAGATVERPMHVVLRSSPAGSAARAIRSGRVLVTLGEGASATVVVTTEAASTGDYLANYHVQYELAAGSRLTVYQVDGDPDDAIVFDSHQMTLAEGADLRMVALAFGSRIARNHYRVDLVGEGANAVLQGTETVGGDREVHKHITVHHRAPATTSNQHFKTILGQSGQASYDGSIIVDEIAQRTDAFQLGANLMLSDDARASVKPSLYIHADDVKCSHGGTCGQLEEEELHYIQTRGIGRAEARRLMITAFALEILDRIEMPSVRELCHRAISERLAGLDEADTVGLSVRDNRAKKR